MCFLCWLPISVLVKDHLSSFSPVILAGVEAMQESLALQGGAHRADGSSLHMSQRSPCWLIIHAHKGNIYFTSPVNSSWYKDSFYLLLLITMKKKMVLLKALPPPLFFLAAQMKVSSQLFSIQQWLVPVHSDPQQLKWMQRFFILPVLMAVHATT